MDLSSNWIKKVLNDFILSIPILFITILDTMNKIFIAFLFIFTISYASQFYMKDNKIYDKNGGVRIFHGVNLV